MSKACNPPESYCCPAFVSAAFYQDPRTMLITDEAGETVNRCPFCGAVVDPVVGCGWSGCDARVNLSAAWIDNRRFLCRRHGLELREKRGRAE